MEIEPIAIFHSPVKEKFGLPRQSCLSMSLRGSIVLETKYRSPEAIRGLDTFDYLWLLWGFNLNKQDTPPSPTVRPPRLGGNTRVGVFASRSPYRPNPIGLSSVKLESVDYASGIIYVSGADLSDGTPIYDIKPYIEYTDSHSGLRCGFVSDNEWKTLGVSISDEYAFCFSAEELSALKEILAQDPRPAYHNDPDRQYGLLFADRNVKFRVTSENLVEVVEIQ